MIATQRASKAVVATAITGTAFIAALAFWLSFTALTHLAIRADIAEQQAWAWPLIVDGVIVVATVAVVALRGRAGSKYAWALLASGASVSVTANAIQAAWPTGRPLPAGMAAAICSVPPIVLLAITHLTVALARHESPAAERSQSAGKAPGEQNDSDSGSQERALDLDGAPWRRPIWPVEPSLIDSDAAGSTQTPPTSAVAIMSSPIRDSAVAEVEAETNPTPESAAGTTNHRPPGAGAAVSGSRAASMAQAAHLHADGLSKRAIAKRLGVSDTTVARWLKEGY